jgi:S-DNA-T family DNA segregation ATPase FtsK/SpoIIIE
MSTVEVHRLRRVVPLSPGGEFALEPPPEPERAVPVGILARLLPLVMLLGSVAFVALSPHDPSSMLFGSMFALSTVGMLFVGGGGRSPGQRQATLDEQRRDYLRYLAVARRRVRTVAAEQRAALEHVHPDPAAWPAVVATGRLWERRGGDPDFGQLRVGRGAQRLATRLVAPQTGPVDTVEPVSALALRRFLRGHSVVADLPVALSLRGSSTVWLEPAPGAGPGAARALARALVAQYVLWHGPDDALLAVVAPAYLAPEWEWVKWLPHIAHPRRRDAIGPVRTVTADADDVRRLVGAELADGPRAPGPVSRTCSWSSTTRPAPAVGRGGRRHGAPGECPTGASAGPIRGPALRGPRRAGSGGPRRRGHRDRAAGRADGGRRDGAGASPRALPPRRLRAVAAAGPRSCRGPARTPRLAVGPG